jgi:hypothetical protein
MPPSADPASTTELELGEKHAQVRSLSATKTCAGAAGEMMSQTITKLLPSPEVDESNASTKDPWESAQATPQGRKLTTALFFKVETNHKLRVQCSSRFNTWQLQSFDEPFTECCRVVHRSA